ncbi:MAG: hypothetical protein P0Y53_19110 [Candidatus Pseudobacter hemicellulosilyticus]|uniref:Uncharacterized protein n=1 Tax=Candidatus Pseudobacter hemicellulosilyticus TaxID=3121375 RepID=A0AAJ5WMD6_9BACT|nr:MAG: hypothetical protein P0Y53_19110 [Pseudobacter sp.]
MKPFQLLIGAALVLTMAGSCDKQNDDLVDPLSAEAFPQVIKFDDEGDGDLEDADAFSFKLTLNDRVDPSGKELGGIVLPLDQDVKVYFAVKEFEGFARLADYIKEAKAFYEIDDCTTSEDQGIDLDLQFDVSTGKGSVIFPKGVTEIEVEFATDEDLLNDDVLNEDERFIVFTLTSVEAAGRSVAINNGVDFTYEVLDDEGVQGDWELDHSDPAAFAAFKALFSSISEDIAGLEADAVEKIEISIEYNEVKVKVELKETEIIEECDGPEEVNKEIEIEADLEDLSLQSADGDIEFVGEIEQTDGSIKEFTAKGSFEIVDGKLQLLLTLEYDDEETDEIQLVLSK